MAFPNQALSSPSLQSYRQNVVCPLNTANTWQRLGGPTRKTTLSTPPKNLPTETGHRRDMFLTWLVIETSPSLLHYLCTPVGPFWCKFWYTRIMITLPYSVWVTFLEWTSRIFYCKARSIQLQLTSLEKVFKRNESLHFSDSSNKNADAHLLSFPSNSYAFLGRTHTNCTNTAQLSSHTHKYGLQYPPPHPTAQRQ